jgi:predicted nucleic-acid-binding protein
MRAIDTNVLVRLITRDDRKQAARAADFVATGSWVSHLVLVETTWVLSAVYALGPAKIGAVIEMLLSHEALSIQAPDVVRAALDHFRRKPALGFSDCLILEVGTFDRDLGTLTGTQRL